jgi:2-dehydropantoate 2-reductase
MNVAVVGCGSLGGVIAVLLSDRPGLRLEVLNRNPLIAEAAVRQGLRLRAGGRRLTARVLMSAAPSRGPYDAVILTQKANGLEQTCRDLLPALTPRGFFVTTQNGLSGLDLLREFGPERVVPACVLWGSSMRAPGAYELTATGPFLLAENGGTAAALAAARGLLSQVFPVRTCPDVASALWSKLAITASLTALGALSGLRFGRLAAAAPIRRRILAIGAEVWSAAASQGVELGALGGGLNVRRFLQPAAQGGYPAGVKQLLLRLLGWKHRRTESSMLDSLLRGRPTEIDFLNGLVVRVAERAGLVAPWNRAVCELVGEMERGERRPGTPNLADLDRRAAAPGAGRAR